MLKDSDLRGPFTLERDKLNTCTQFSLSQSVFDSKAEELSITTRGADDRGTAAWALFQWKTQA
jgi:hypothetical protein